MIETKEKPLTKYELDFLSYWLINGNNAQKAYQTIHPDCKESTAKVNGCRILTRANVKAEIDRRTAELVEKTGRTAQDLDNMYQETYDLAKTRLDPNTNSMNGSIMGLARIHRIGADGVSSSTGLTINVTTDRKVIDSKEIEDE